MNVLKVISDIIIVARKRITLSVKSVKIFYMIIKIYNKPWN